MVKDFRQGLTEAHLFTFGKHHTVFWKMVGGVVGEMSLEACSSEGER